MKCHRSLAVGGPDKYRYGLKDWIFIVQIKVIPTDILMNRTLDPSFAYVFRTLQMVVLAVFGVADFGFSAV